MKVRQDFVTNSSSSSFLICKKNLTEEQIFNAVKIARDNGLKGFKFYGMIGIPTETQEDLEDRQKKDNIKTQYCLDHNIKLIRIPYWDFKNIENILKQELNLE